MSNIAFEHITKRYSDGFEAVKDMNVNVDDGEFMVLVGPSGSGKSTALRMVAGLEDITEGELKIGNEIVNQREAKDRDVAMVFQSYALYPRANPMFSRTVMCQSPARALPSLEDTCCDSTVKCA